MFVFNKCSMFRLLSSKQYSVFISYFNLLLFEYLNGREVAGNSYFRFIQQSIWRLQGIRLFSGYIGQERLFSYFPGLWSKSM